MKRRDLKKDIYYLVDDVLSECSDYALFYGEKQHEAIAQVEEQILNTGNELLDRAGRRPETKDAKEIKQYYRAIRNDLMTAVTESYDKLNKLSHN